MDRLELWRRYKQHLCSSAKVGLSLDISRMKFADDFFRRMEPAMQAAFENMRELEQGAIANPDEGRMVGHYWLRAAGYAPDEALTETIEKTVKQVAEFAQQIHKKQITTPDGNKFSELLVIGIGGSALGPQFVADALSSKRDKLTPHFLDNTDPDGIDRTLTSLGAKLKRTLVVVISKSGSTPETRNGMLETQAAFIGAGLDFASHAVAITGEGSKLDQTAEQQGWLARFPMWDWVGGRTSITSAVGLVPMALQGVDINAFLAGAAEMDQLTRVDKTKKNPAAILALMWHHATDGIGSKDMVVLPYKDRLLLFSRYLQQLIMESLGKELDLDGNVVNQGIAVYGNKGSTDQHAYVQQLRDGLNNFFATFIVVLRDDAAISSRRPDVIEVEDGVTSGDYLSGFWQGTRDALYDSGRESITITLDRVDAGRVGALIALYERAVGLYASLININAYHQPGVEAGKKAAADVLDLQQAVVAFLREQGESLTAEQIADGMGRPRDVERINHILEHLGANKRGIVASRSKFRFKA